ncbi:MAG TPA: response regulator [Xanthobacteraceae bacterium]|jgi:DNA-binding NtrC family response regulator|nr:response regulator [Xanthobacteraceae bacterium]
MPRSISMLIADDASVYQQILHDAARISKLPLRLCTTDNGRDCLTMLNGAHVDLAFIDVNMPELSGTEAFWTARKQGIQTFVTLMSTPPAAEAMQAAIKLKAYEFLLKPFTVIDTVAIIKTYHRISSPTKVLVVDDSSAVRRIAQKILQGSVFNCEIEEAPDGETALALCRTAPFDAVFLDCNMPGLGGLNTLKWLLVTQPHLKVVMISSEHNLGAERQALDAGACAFLHKPFTSEDVDQVLHAAFGLRSPNLRVNGSQPNFDVAIEGSTIRVAHRSSGHVFEYLWCEKPPYLRNAVVRAAATCQVAPMQIAPAAAKSALSQLKSARLVTAAAA